MQLDFVWLNQGSYTVFCIPLVSVIPYRPFSISTASLINNASQRIKNISRVLLAVKEREETEEMKERLTPF